MYKNMAFKSSVEERECKCSILFPNLSNVLRIYVIETLQKFMELVA